MGGGNVDAGEVASTLKEDEVIFCLESFSIPLRNTEQTARAFFYNDGVELRY